MVDAICGECKKEIRVSKWNLDRSKSGLVFCNKRCYGNSLLGSKLSDKVKNNLRKKRIGEKNPNWKGKRVGYNGIHCWIKNRKKRPKNCSDCGERGPVDLANISQQYKRDIGDWEWLCRRCHMSKDGRLEALIKRNKAKKRKACIVPECSRHNHAYRHCRLHWRRLKKHGSPHLKLSKQGGLIQVP